MKVKSISRTILFFDGRPDRDTKIDQDDINNLKIALNDKAPIGTDPLYYFLLNT